MNKLIVLIAVVVCVAVCNARDAGMEISAVTRSCGVLMSDTPKCTPIFDLVEVEQKANYFSKRSKLPAQYKTVKYNGRRCQSVDGYTWPVITDSGNSLGLASNLIMMCFVILRLYE